MEKPSSFPPIDDAVTEVVAAVRRRNTQHEKSKNGVGVCCDIDKADFRLASWKKVGLCRKNLLIFLIN